VGTGALERHITGLGHHAGQGLVVVGDGRDEGRLDRAGDDELVVDGALVPLVAHVEAGVGVGEVVDDEVVVVGGRGAVGQVGGERELGPEVGLDLQVQRDHLLLLRGLEAGRDRGGGEGGQRVDALEEPEDGLVRQGAGGGGGVDAEHRAEADGVGGALVQVDDVGGGGRAERVTGDCCQETEQV